MNNSEYIVAIQINSHTKKSCSFKSSFFCIYTQRPHRIQIIIIASISQLFCTHPLHFPLHINTKKELIPHFPHSNYQNTTVFTYICIKKKMIHSMTGYGKATAELPGKKITVEIKSLNGKQFDLFTRIPHIYKEKEIALRNDLSKILERGRVELFINVEESDNDSAVKIDEARLKNYHNEVKQLAAALDIEEPTNWLEILFKLPDVFKQEPEKLNEEEWSVVEKAVDGAVATLISFRHQEGEALKQTMLTNISNIKKLTLELEKFEAERLEKVKTRITDALNNLENVTYDGNRLEQELIYYIEKLDVNEEKTRLLNHLDYFLETIESDTSQGKKLGFIVQEIGREVNTLGSKSNDSNMQRIVVQMKDEMEQIKEQILNVL